MDHSQEAMDHRGQGGPASRADTRPYHDDRDLTPFRDPHVRSTVRGLASSVGDAVAGALGGHDPGRIAVVGEVPRLKRRSGNPAKAVHDAIFNSTTPERLITLARAYPGWAGLCTVMAGLLAYKHGGYLRAAELLRRGLQTRIDDDASHFSATYLRSVVTRVEVAERMEVPVLFSEESVFLALAHCLRETGQTAAALEALAALPPSLPTVLARCTAASALGRHADVVAWTEGLLNADDLSAALLLIRARSLRALGLYGASFDALKEVLRRKKTRLALRNDALTDRALLALDVGRKALLTHAKPSKDLERTETIRKDAEMHRLWDSDFKNLGGE